ncbi:MAG: hypothetical protein M1826_005644 [Phylliscum demangeonii]|nr:MAG: hypothetical protein M1826_005644 [Phylliscum demangeonii]
MAAVMDDVAFLSTYMSLPQDIVAKVIEEPTKDFIHLLVQAIALKTNDCERVKAINARLEVELENSVRTSDSRIRTLKGSLTQALKELGVLRERLSQDETTRMKLQDELQTLKASSADSDSEIYTLRSRLSSVESASRDTVAVLESKSSAFDRLTEELGAQQQKAVEFRRQIVELEQSLQTANAAATSAKFRESSLTQELDLQTRNNEWLDGELKTRSAENSKSRKEKNAKIADLQRQNEEARSVIESLQRTETALRTRLEEVEAKADQAFTRTQKLQEEAAQAQESFQNELASRQHLAELLEKSANTARERLEDVQASYDQLQEKTAEELGRVHAEMETERSEKQAAEARAVVLDGRLEQLEAHVVDLSQSTPSRRLNGSRTPGQESAFSPSPARLKPNLTITQMYGEYTTMQAQLQVERRRNKKLSKTVDAMIQDLQTKQPEIDDLRADHERLEAEMLDMADAMKAKAAEREKLRRDARRWEGQVKSLEGEGGILRQQLRDLSLQIRVLLTEIHARYENLEVLDPVQQLTMDRILDHELDDSALDNLTDTGRLISRRLTIFKNVQELQEQNTKLLRLTRELGEKMEGNEAIAQQNQHARQLEELEELRRKVAANEDEMKAAAARSESQLKERDMLRRMLQQRGHLPAETDLASLFEESVAEPGLALSVSRVDGGEQSMTASEIGDQRKLLKEMQAHFDAYREETSTDRRALKDQADRLAREKSELQADVAKAHSQATLARERLEMLQANFSMLKTENSELQKRSNALAESATMQDLRTQQVAEELVESKGLVDSMQKETANLRADKQLAKRIESRLSEDNAELLKERNRLNGLIGSLQNLQNERELSDSESRRKLQTQVEIVSSELQTVKRKLEDEVEDSRKSAMRREIDGQQKQKIVDDLRSGLSVVREELVAAQTTRDHLQVRVDELTIELKSAEGRLHALQPRAGHAAEGAEPETPAEQAARREEELSLEISELKRELDLAQSELENSKGQVAQYKNISQTSEDQLQSLNDTYDEYRAEVDRLLSEKDATIQEINQSIETLKSELSAATTELSAVKASQAEREQQVAEEKRVMESDISRLKDENERHAAAAHFHQQDLRTQAEIAQDAQQNYENELLKHAEAAKTLQEVRKEYHQLKTEVVQFKTEAEAATVALDQNETSWEETRQRYDGELLEMRRRRDDVNKQNDLLHKQLEAVSSEIAALRQQRSSFFEREDAMTGVEGPSDRTMEELREIVSFLRRDKEIVDVQYELSIQESKRFKQQLDYVQSQLDDCRLKLDQERRSRVEGDKSSLTHKELLQKITELNLYRESTVTLRHEAREAQSKLALKAQEVEDLMAQIQPLRATVEELEGEKEMREGEVKLLQEDRDRYQQRLQGVLQKYDRVDPAELEALKEELEALRTQHTELLAEKEKLEPLKAQVDGFPEILERAKETATATLRDVMEKRAVQYKERSRNLTTAKNDLILENQALVNQKKELEAQLKASREEAERLKTERDDARRMASPASQGSGSRRSSASTQPTSPTPTFSMEEKQALERRAAAADSRVLELEQELQKIQGDISQYGKRIAELEEQLLDAQRLLDIATARVAQLESAPPADADAGSSYGVELEHIHQELLVAEQQIETLRTEAAVVASINSAAAEDGSKTVAQQVSEQVEAIRQDLDVRHAERVKLAEIHYKSRADKMRTTLTETLTKRKDQIRETLENEQREALEKLRTEHQKEIEELNSRHQQDQEQLKAEEKARFEQQKQALVADQATGSSQAQTSKADQQPSLEGPPSEWDIPEPQLRELARTHPIIQSILRNNISVQTKKAKEETDRLAEEKIQDAIAKAEKEKEQGIAMEIQRQKVKLSVAEAKARLLAVKTDVVQKAATETPQRPVNEVWEVAKVAKLAVVPPAQPAPSAPPAAVPVTENTTAAATGNAPAPGYNPFANAPNPARSNFGPFAHSTFGMPSSLGQSAMAGMSFPATQPAYSHGFPQHSTSMFSQQPILFGTPSFEGSYDGGFGVPAPLGMSSLPVKPPHPGQPGPDSGTGPGALRTLMAPGQSMLPRANSSGNRGNRTNSMPETSAPASAQVSGPPSRTQQSVQQQQQSTGGGRNRGGKNRGGRGGDWSDAINVDSQSSSPSHGFNQRSPSGRSSAIADGQQSPNDPRSYGRGGDSGGESRKRSRDEGSVAEVVIETNRVATNHKVHGLALRCLQDKCTWEELTTLAAALDYRQKAMQVARSLLAIMDVDPFVSDWLWDYHAWLGDPTVTKRTKSTIRQIINAQLIPKPGKGEDRFGMKPVYYLCAALHAKDLTDDEINERIHRAQRWRDQQIDLTAERYMNTVDVAKRKQSWFKPFRASVRSLSPVKRLRRTTAGSESKAQ